MERINLALLGTSPRRWCIVIMGLPGSGKTTLAKRIAEHFALHHIELDAGRWGEGWEKSSPEAEVEFVQMQIAAHPEGWVFCGDNALATRTALAEANIVLWLNFPAWKTALRFLRRTWTRIFTREELWNGNHERIRVALFKHPYEIARNLWMAADVNRSYRQELAAMVAKSPALVHHFHTDEEVEVWFVPSLIFFLEEDPSLFYARWMLGWLIYSATRAGVPPPPDIWWEALNKEGL